MNEPALTDSTASEEPENLLPGEMRPVERMQRAIRRPSERFRPEARQVKREKVAVRLASAAAHLVARIPLPVRDIVVDAIGAIWIRSTPRYRENVMANIGQVLGPDVSRAELEQIAKRVFRLSADNFAELLRMRVAPSSRVVAEVPSVASDLEIFHTARATGKGIVVLTAHLGAFDLVGLTIGASGIPLTVMTGRTTSRMLFDAVAWLRGGHGVRVVEPTPAGVKEVIKALRRGEVAGLVSDYDFFQNGVPVTLFGRETTLPPGAVRIARDTGSIIVPMFAYREDGEHRLRVGESFTVPRTHDVGADVAGGMAVLARRLEDGIGATPDQWVLFQRAWPSEPALPDGDFPAESPLESEPLIRIDAEVPGKSIE
jgi:KDO2-lipid IV(A) lauroyltransferase